MNTTGGEFGEKYPFPVPQKACSWFHFARMESRSSLKTVGRERAEARLATGFVEVVPAALAAVVPKAGAPLVPKPVENREPPPRREL